MQPQSLPGFRDFYPEDLALRKHLFATWRRVARSYGFEEFDGPPLEPLELYTAKSGSEIVEQLYAFTDKGGREVSLRPEMTPTVARMVAARAGGFKKPIRWFSIPQLFRYERQQRGRLREHFQLNCDLIGEPGPLADAEVIALAIDVMRALGLGPDQVRVRLSDREVLGTLLAGQGVAEGQLEPVFQAIDKIERVPRDKLAAGLAEAGLTKRQTEGVFEVAGLRGRRDLERALGSVPLGEEVASRFLVVHDALATMGLADFVEVDLTIVRGLAYYTGVVFELFDAGGTMRAICGGGRYDDLLQLVGGTDLPAVGFGMGDVVLGDLLRERGLAPEAETAVTVFVAAVSEQEMPAALELTHRLRDAGVSTEVPLRHSPLGKQLKLAGARGARWAVVLGPEESARGEVVLRDLSAGDQKVVPIDSVVERLGGLEA